MIKGIELERFSLTISKPFDQVVAALDAAVGRPDMAEFVRSTHEARSFAELKSAVESPYGNPDALQVAQDLDKKVKDLLKQVAA